jgi:hypothetical protein
LNSASKRSTGVGDCESDTMRTFDNGMVGFSRRRAVALNASDSLMGVDESIDRDPFEGGAQLWEVTSISDLMRQKHKT